MKNLPKSIFSLLIALLLVAVLLILPDADVTFKKQLDFLTKSDNAAIAFGYYLLQKIISGALVIFLTITISIAGHRTYKKYRSEI
ncbi:hypothetical protein KKH23_02690 [Patescibacteria group bacterium]|nr:hypothetical protein [Patescibacteria group bacterium]MBU0777446.1 hypothetical protein [Patescibacteria group bacterium]MBU0846081.1 hypothetical protein [Patescibacteria group bacterium]MBU0923134.1 hypothetical protein [Patescibacteria group bacterium]MBU1066849.1 hypothetical protein [Patescibacteria group bacterium]